VIHLDQLLDQFFNRSVNPVLFLNSSRLSQALKLFQSNTLK